MMTSPKIITIKNYLAETYTIPSYQREYSWETNELEDFWNDFEEISSSKEHSIEHFLGQIVIHNDETEDKKFIIDGQQRTITSMIFLRALQALYEEIYSLDNTLTLANRNSVRISDSYLGAYDDFEKSLHLKLPEPDNEFYIKNIILNKPDKSVLKKKTKKSMIKMEKAYLYFYNKIKTSFATTDLTKQEEILNNYLTTFSTKVCLLYVETTNLEEAFIIFETLNARGKNLETADLLKNTIFKNLKDDINEAKQKWASMSDKLDTVDGTKYIRTIWNTQHNFTREKALFKTICNEINSKKDSKDFLKVLEEYADKFHDIVEPNNTITIENESLKKHLINLKTLKIKAFYPVILAMFERQFSEQDIAKIAHTLENYCFRKFTICKQNPNSNEIFLASIAKNIYNENFDTVDSIKKEIIKEDVSEELFCEQFSLWTGSASNKDIVQYILRKINNFYDEKSEIKLNAKDVNIEHIMPEAYKEHWSYTEEYHDDYIWRLGNLTLLSDKINKGISNNKFKDKILQYKDSRIFITEKLTNYDEWDKTAIEARQQEFSLIASRIWQNEIS